MPTKVAILISLLHKRELELRKIDLLKVAQLVSAKARVRTHMCLPVNH